MQSPGTTLLPCPALASPTSMIVPLRPQGGHGPQLRQHIGCTAGVVGGCEEFVPLRGMEASRGAQVSARYCPEPSQSDPTAPLLTTLHGSPLPCTRTLAPQSQTLRPNSAASRDSSGYSGYSDQQPSASQWALIPVSGLCPSPLPQPSPTPRVLSPHVFE